MAFIIGTIFLGKVHEVKDQWIETKFIIIGVPLMPVASMLVTSSAFRGRKGFSVPLHQTSIIAGYARVYAAILAVVFLFLGTRSGGALLTGILFLAVWIYFFFVFGQEKNEGVESRNKIGNITGLFAPPEWLDSYDAYAIYEKIEKKYTLLFMGSDWLNDLQQGEIPREKIPLLYALSRYNYALGPTDENRELFEKADGLYIEADHVNPKRRETNGVRSQTED
ncbi:hypothetical protein [Mucilaginibacter xinganensis]|uniref:Uncharacterized protein n=1 Tax=Mucilaginibacter xinganensis TaxID=1234841 RepID=A0A223P457_9SPHI|nr:hypothetical protein [Mucilaginibacter xinganensis]ASU36628.1 hypothetical protein MuYL_4745 [Mucilaginibacter xinganensis]